MIFCEQQLNLLVKKYVLLPVQNCRVPNKVSQQSTHTTLFFDIVYDIVFWKFNLSFDIANQSDAILPYKSAPEVCLFYDQPNGTSSDSRLRSIWDWFWYSFVFRLDICPDKLAE